MSPPSTASTALCFLPDTPPLLSPLMPLSFDGDLKTWVFIRERTDKNTPNDFTVYHKVVKSIEDNIDDAEIIERTAEASGRSIYDRDRSRKCVIK